MTNGCPAPEDLARAVSQGASTEMAEHIASCDACSLEWKSAGRLRQLARSLTSEAPASAKVLRMREHVVARAVAERRRGQARLGLFVALALAAAAVLAIGLRGPAGAPVAKLPSARYHGTIAALGDARFSRMSSAPDELVVLESGTIHVEVSPLLPGERFRVRAADGEVEVRGTAFDVAVESGHMSRVAVEHGRVEVRRIGASVTELGAGESWKGIATPSLSGSETPGSATSSEAVSGTAPVAPSHGSKERPAPRAPAASTPQPSSPEASAVASAPEEEPGIASRSGAHGASATPVAPPASGTEHARPSPLQPTPTQSAESAPKDDDRARDEERRERRDERRERHDQRRFR